MNITNVQVDIANATVTITFSDGTNQVVTAPLAPATQGVSLADLQKEQTDLTAVATAESAVQADVTAEVAEVTPAQVEPAAPTTN